MKQIELTYIIPFYNGVESIFRQLDSIYATGLDENLFEVIVVDDCSPCPAEDGLKGYCGRHANLRVVRHSENKRQGGAKNTGIREARGWYVAFADQDDVVISEHVSEALQRAISRGADMLSCRWELQTEKGDVCVLGIEADDGVCENGVVFCEQYVDPRVSFGPWSYLYRREFLLATKHPMAEHVRMEDADWIAWHLFHAKRVVFFGKPVYRWLYRMESTSHSKHYYTKNAWIKLGLRIINDCDEYGKLSKTFARKMYENGLYDIELQFASLWEINNYRLFFLDVRKDGLVGQIMGLPLPKRVKRMLKYPQLYSMWFMLYKPIRLLGHRIKCCFS